MSSTPRAEQFEDRLKTIIHSVLSGDEKPQDLKNLPHNLPPTSSSSSSQNKPMFSPVKKELPSHLPPPPSGVVLNKKAHGGGSSQVSLPQMGSARTMHEIIEKEIERNLGAPENPRRMPATSPMSPQKLVRQPPSSRMSQVIEDSIRGLPGPRPPSELEGLACPRTKSPSPPVPPPNPVGPPGLPHLPPGSKAFHGDDYREYPAMEGLGARFNSFMNRKVENNDLLDGPHGGQPQLPPHSHGGPGSRAFDKRGPWEQQHPNNAYRYPGHHYQQQQQPPMSVTPGGPSSGHHGPPGSYGGSLPPRKRASPSGMPVLPPKKAMVDSGVDYSFHKGNLKTSY